MMVEGAVYTPWPEMLPSLVGLSDHEMPVLPVPVTVALSCCVCEGPNVALDGDTLTLTLVEATRFTVAVSNLFISLIAVTVIVCPLGTEAGAVYRPVEEMLPTAGLIDHVYTPLLPLAVNCAVCEALRETDEGEIDTFGLAAYNDNGCRAVSNNIAPIMAIRALHTA